MSSSMPPSSASSLQVASQQMNDAVGQAGVYIGQIDVASGLPQGRGSMNYVTPDNSNGNGNGNGNNTTSSVSNPNMIVASYEGEWQAGFWQGHGICVLKNGDSYTGEFVQHERHGNGEYQWKMGANKKQRLYQGMFHHNQRHGHGKYIWRTLQATGNNEPDEPEELEVVSESTYVGMFDNGQRQGHGVYQSPSLTYTGDWKAGQYHGYGCLEQSSTNRTYKGYFHRGQKHGRGIETDTTTDTCTVIYDGQWRNDQPSNEEEGDPVLLDPTDNGTTNTSHQQQQQQQQQRQGHRPTAPNYYKPTKPQTIVLSHPEPCIDGQGREGLYKGIMQDNLPEGVGTMKYQHHPELMMEYEGFWVQGMKHGFGRVLYMNGDSYQGDFDQNKKQGQGEWKLSDGRQFKGVFLDDLPHTSKVEEKIRVVYPQNDMFHGQYANGNRSGKGRFTWVDGGYYDGFWVDGLYQGTGELGTAHTKYMGEFQKGKYEGQGKLVNLLTDEIIYEGSWKAGVPADDLDQIPDGKKLLQIPQPPLDSDVAQSRQRGRTAAPATFAGSSSSSHNNKGTRTELLSKSACKAVVDLSVVDAQDNPGRYTGIVHVTSQKPHGVGRMVYDDGNRVHEGFWEYGHRQGHGRCLFVQIGDFHEGNYEQNLRQGPGTYYWKDGRQFVGQYEEDERHGPGVFTYNNGDIYDGNFEHGQRCGFGTFTFHNETCQYKGEWKAGMYNGGGQLTWQSVKETRKVTPTSEQITRETCKHRYEGNFASGVFDGEGKEFENDTLVRQGKWAKGKFVEESAVPVTAPDLLDEPENDTTTPPADSSTSGPSTTTPTTTSQATGQDEEETTNKAATATGDNTAEVGAPADTTAPTAEKPVTDENQAPTPAPQKETVPAAPTESQTMATV
ncbi:MAG: hypothetical protein SGBAC_006200 [Bacillariaceae sp.]